ncbi:MAG: hydrogenase maturation peptidase HycI [Candidatus Margulisiibacteriota bacterium]
MPTDLKAELTSRLKGATRVVLLGVGSDLRGDDAAGMLVAAQLQNAPKPTVLLGGTAPENLTGEIKKLKPSHLLIVDAAELKAAPGTVKLLTPEEIGGFSFSTHALPLKVMIDFILADWQCAVTIIAIQPADTRFGAPVHPAVNRAVGELADSLKAVISS